MLLVKKCYIIHIFRDVALNSDPLTVSSALEEKARSADKGVEWGQASPADVVVVVLVSDKHRRGENTEESDCFCTLSGKTRTRKCVLCFQLPGR